MHYELVSFDKTKSPTTTVASRSKIVPSGATCIYSAHINRSVFSHHFELLCKVEYTSELPGAKDSIMVSKPVNGSVTDI
jgi:hypothetical protein